MFLFLRFTARTGLPWAVFGILMMLAPVEALACRCVEIGPSAAYPQAAAVVYARVLSVAPVPEGIGTVAALDVRHAWKRNVMKSLSVVSLTDCAFEWQAEMEYILFLMEDAPNTYSTGKCLGNRPVDGAADVRTWLDLHATSADLLPN